MTDIDRPIPPSKLSRLTDREKEILRLIAEGLSLAEISRVLFRSQKTIQSHRLSIGRKLGVRNRVQLTRIAIDAGLISTQTTQRQSPSSSSCNSLPPCFLSPPGESADLQCDFTCLQNTIPVYECNLISKTRTFSDNIAQFFNNTLPALGNGLDPWLQRVHPADQPLVQNLIQSLLAGNPSIDLLYRIITPTGILWVKERASRLPSSENQPPRSIGFLIPLCSQRADHEAKRRPSSPASNTASTNDSAS